MNESSSKKGGGIAPFGYRWNGGKLVQDPVEAPIRKLIFELYIKHRRKKAVARILNELGHHTRRGSVFYETTVDRLIACTSAKGQWTSGTTTINTHPIVSDELWNQANSILQGNTPSKQPSQLFHGIIYCGCGDRMTASSESLNYRCSKCRRKISIVDVEAIFQSQLETFEEKDKASASQLWDRIGPKDKRILIEQMCSRITVGNTEIEFEFAYDPQLDRESVSKTEEVINEVNQRSSVVPIEPASSLMTESEAAEFLGVSPRTVNRRRTKGELGFYRLGTQIRYSREKHLLPYLERQERRRNP